MAKKKDPSHIKDLVPDPENARNHTPRNIGMIEDSIQAVGLARSIVIDEDGTILAGNGTIEAAGNVGTTKLRVIDADGDEVIAVRRKDLTREQKRLLALFDNRASDLAGWNVNVLKDIPIDERRKAFTDEEFKALIAAAEKAEEEAPPEFPSADKDSVKTEHVCPRCSFRF